MPERRKKKRAASSGFICGLLVAAAEICRGVHGYPSTPQLFNQL